MSDSTDHAAVWVPPPLLFAVPFGVGVALGVAMPWRLPFGDTPRVAAGVALITVGASLAVAAVFTFTKHGTTILPARRRTTAIVATGPYRFTRNPMYVGMAMGYLGLALIVSSMWALLLCPFALGVVDRYAIRREERYLSRKFGAPYDAYRRQVRRWL